MVASVDGMWQSAVVLALSAGLVCTGCGEDRAAPAPRHLAVGGPAFVPATPPPGEMSGWERRVAARLGQRLGRDDGLSLDHLDCPRVHHTPARLTCDGYVDGVVGQVRVRLSRWRRGGVEFDAVLAAGVVSTANLVSRVSSAGGRADCGPTPAYPARVGTRIVCAVRRAGGQAYVVATVTDRSGTVEITGR